MHTRGGLKEVTSKGPTSLEILQLQFTFMSASLATGTADRHIVEKGVTQGVTRESKPCPR